MLPFNMQSAKRVMQLLLFCCFVFSNVALISIVEKRRRSNKRWLPRLSRQGCRAHHAARRFGFPTSLLKAMDTNKDGVVSKEAC